MPAAGTLILRTGQPVSTRPVNTDGAACKSARKMKTLHRRDGMRRG